MKVYVHELPKSCDDCEFGYFYDCQYCTLRPDLMKKDEWCEKEKHCPLLSTQSLKQQVREEVCEEIKSEIIKHHEWKYEDCYTNSEVIECVLDIIEENLDQIQGEKNVQG